MVARDLVLLEEVGRAAAHRAPVLRRERARWCARRSGGACGSPPRPRRTTSRSPTRRWSGYEHPRQDEPAAAASREDVARRARGPAPTAPSTPSPPTTRPTASWTSRCEFDEAANGVVGLETALPLTLELVHGGRARPGAGGGAAHHGPGAGFRPAGRTPGAGRAGRRDARGPRGGVDGGRGAVLLQEPQHALQWPDRSRAG